MELQVLFSGVPYTGTLPQGEALLVTQGLTFRSFKGLSLF